MFSGNINDFKRNLPVFFITCQVRFSNNLENRKRVASILCMLFLGLVDCKDLSQVECTTYHDCAPANYEANICPFCLEGKCEEILCY